MRSVLALGLLITLCVSSHAAATLHRSKPSRIDLRRHQWITVRPDQGVTGPTGFAVPGWTVEQTRQWLDNASAGSGLG
jgi:hypothetical protein